MLKELSGKPLIYWVIERVKRATEVDYVILATTDNELDLPLAEYAESLDVMVFRGSESDVLGRFADAVKHVDANIVVRVCADNPLVDPEVIDYAVALFKQSSNEYMYNHIPRNGCRYPDGLGVEIFNRYTLETLANTVKLMQHREHVTSYIWDNLERFAVNKVKCPAQWDAEDQPIKLDIDSPEDLDSMRKLCATLNIESTAQEIIHAWRAIYIQE